jgi:predicted transcriptional regulator of viral defense system
MRQTSPTRQQHRAEQLLRVQGMARLAELTKAGVTAATMSRMLEKGLVTKLGRGIYQLTDAQTETHHSLAQAAKRVPRGIVCLVSALAFHDLTDTMPRQVWIAIGAKAWRPIEDDLPLRIVRFGAKVLDVGVEQHRIEGVPVRITTPAKTIVDLFRYSRRSGAGNQRGPSLELFLEGMREALRQRKATPAEIAQFAEQAGVWKALQPYLETMAAHG